MLKKTRLRSPVPWSMLTATQAAILQALADGKARYGYHVLELSRVAPGSIYVTANRLANTGMLSTWTEQRQLSVNGRKTSGCDYRLYRITPLGLHWLRAHIEAKRIAAAQT